MLINENVPFVFALGDFSFSDAAGLAGMTKTTASYKDDFNLSSITAPTSATITGILVGDVNNSWLIPA